MPSEALAKEGGVHALRLFSGKRSFRRSALYRPDEGLKQRLADHNAGKSPHTSKYTPWRLVTYVAFSDIEKARAFERYLKSGSGHAFAKKRLW